MWRRKYNTEHNIPAEHPRVSTTDDVECFFSVLRNSIGKDFTLKEVCTLIKLTLIKLLIGVFGLEESYRRIP